LRGGDEYDMVKDYVDEFETENYQHNPGYGLGYAMSILISAKKEMEKENLINGDNYYHRLAMCEIGKQAQKENIPYSLLGGFVGGILKEGYDFTKKNIFKENKMKNIFNDSIKDMNNNIEGLNFGLNNSKKSCRDWLRNLDIKTNSWKKNEKK